jgi:hypothetical protein
MDKQTVLELLANALAAMEQLTVDGLTSEDPDAADAFGDMRGTIERAMETVGYYAD